MEGLMARIVLEGVNLTFRVRHHQRTGIGEFVRRLLRLSVRPVMEVKALQDCSLTIANGDRLGIIGHNGAGKSTLLRVLAGIYPPTSGSATVEGRISSIFDICLGFELEASGWDNIRFRGYLQGETPRSMRDKIQPIAEFSGVDREFLDMPVRYYSAGMYVRLAFAIATAIDPEVLLVDEALSVGDMAFMEKAGQRMRDMIDKAKLIVMVSHDLESIKRVCNRAIWMDHGRIRLSGSPSEVVDAYKAGTKSDMNRQAA
jgi:ABC-type polysaccharide/polyol phosphate transport system ATPase subunit